MEELKQKFAKRLGKVVGKMRRDIETGYIAGGVHVEKYAKLMEKRRMRMNRYVRRRLDAMSRKYGLPVQQAYGDFRERLEIAFAELQMEYGLIQMPVPARI
jgi:hypothetical protein